MLTRADIEAMEQTRFVQHPEGVMVYKPSEGAMLVLRDDLPELIMVAAKALRERE